MSKTGMSLKADIGLRIGGLLLLALGACAIKLLYAQVHALPAHEASLLEMVIGALGFLGLSVGGVLATLGRHIYDPVQISERWSEPPPHLTHSRPAA